MKGSYRFYRCCYRIARAGIAVVYRLDISGRENIPEGAVMVCANHSSTIDPVLLAFAFGIDHFLHVVAKKELFRIPVLSVIIKGLGAISVDREVSDVGTVRSMLTHLKSGDKVVIFPEGTRVSKDDAVSAKSGAVKIAERAKVPLLPVFIPRKKPFFRKLTIVIGENYCIEKHEGKLSPEDYNMLADVLMGKIKALDPDMRVSA